jgi:hypothetical protein
MIEEKEVEPPNKRSGAEIDAGESAWSNFKTSLCTVGILARIGLSAGRGFI